MGSFSIDSGAISGFLKAAAESPIVKSEALKASSESSWEIADRVGADCAGYIEGMLMASGASGYMISAIGQVSAGTPVQQKEGQYRINIYMEQNARPSLVPELYDGVPDIAALWNNGYSADDYVYGVWHGEPIRSRRYLSGTHFVQDGIEYFNKKYANGPIKAYAWLEGDRFT